MSELRLAAGQHALLAQWDLVSQLKLDPNVGSCGSTLDNLSHSAQVGLFCKSAQTACTPVRIQLVAGNPKPHPRYCERQESPTCSPARQTKTPHDICSPTLGPDVSHLLDSVWARVLLVCGVGSFARSGLNIKMHISY